MSSSIKKLEEEALNLPLNQRALLVENLIKSLDTEEDAASEELWLKEAEQRYKEYKKGTVKTRPANSVFKDTRSQLK
jgi:putative addiction module component (TIGR02574 family)